MAVGTGLVDVRHLAKGAVEKGRRQCGRGLPGVEADAALIGKLVVEIVAHGADLALEPQPGAQDARPGKGAAVAELGKFQFDQREAIDVVAQLFGVFIGLQPHAQGRVAGQKAFARRLEARQRHRHRAVGQAGVIGHAGKAIGGLHGAAVLNPYERHTSVPDRRRS